MTTVIHQVNDKVLKAMFDLSAECNSLRPKFIVAAEKDPKLQKSIENAYIELLEYKIDCARGNEIDVLPSVQDYKKGANTFWATLNVPDQYRDILNSNTLKSVAKHPVLLRQVELMLLGRHNNLG